MRECPRDVISSSDGVSVGYVRTSAYFRFFCDLVDMSTCLVRYKLQKGLQVWNASSKRIPQSCIHRITTRLWFLQLGEEHQHNVLSKHGQEHKQKVLLSFLLFFHPAAQTEHSCTQCQIITVSSNTRQIRCHIDVKDTISVKP